MKRYLVTGLPDFALTGPRPREWLGVTYQETRHLDCIEMFHGLCHFIAELRAPNFGRVVASLQTTTLASPPLKKKEPE